MAKKKTQGSGAKRGTNKTLSKRNQTKVAMPRLVDMSKDVYGFPQQLVSKLRYCDTMNMSPSSGSLVKQVFRLNSVFDPDLSGVGHQPLYRDTFAAIYDQYAVISTRITVTIVNTGSVPIHCGCVVEDDSTSSTSYTTLMEQSTGQHKLIPAQAGSLSSHTFVYDWDCKRHLGIDPFASETYKTAVGSNPTEESDYLVWLQPVDLASSFTTYLNVEMDMVVLWTELTTPTGS